MENIKNSISKSLLFAFTICISLSLNAQVPKAYIYWQFKTKEIHTYPLIIDTIAYVGSMDSSFYAINVKTGKQIWKYRSERPITTHASVAEGVICFNAGNKLYGLDVKTGEKKWSFVDRNDAPRGFGATDCHYSSPFIYKNVAYYGDEWGNVNGVDIKTGNRVFKYSVTTANKIIRCMPVVKDDIIYFGDGGRTLFAISVKDSSVKWIHELVIPAESPKWDGTVVSDMVIRDTLLFAGRYCNALAPVSINTGKVAWIYPDGETFLPNTPVFYQDKVIMAGTINSSKIHCINIKDGKAAWVVKSMGVHFTTPTFYRDSILIINSTDPFSSSTSQGSNVGIMNFINCKNGKILNDLHLNDATESSPIVIGDTILIGKNDGLYAIKITPFLKANDTSKLKIDNAEETITIKKTDALGKYFYVENAGLFCDSMNITAVTQGDESKKNIVPYLRANYNILPGEKVSYGLNAAAAKLVPGSYKVIFTITSNKKAGTNKLEKTVSLVVLDNTALKSTSFNSNPYPNPFNNEVNFPVPVSNYSIKLSIYTVEGKQLFSKTYPKGATLLKWNGLDFSGNSVPKGTYLYTLINGSQEISGKIIK